MTKLLYQTVEAMTMPFTLTLAVTDEGLGQVLLDKVSQQVHRRLLALEDKFSAFKPESLVSRYRQGDGTVAMDREFQEVYTRAFAAEKETAGAFDPYFDGGYNPTGLVKGWAIETVFETYLQPLLVYPYVDAVCLNGAGDMQLATAATSDFSWTVGIEKADDPGQLVSRLTLKEGAVATSGYSKKGRHIKGETSRLEMVTIIDRSLTRADIWATSLLAAAADQVEDLIAQHKLSGLCQTLEQIFYFQHGVITDVKNA